MVVEMIEELRTLDIILDLLCRAGRGGWQRRWESDRQQKSCVLVCDDKIPLFVWLINQNDIGSGGIPRCDLNMCEGGFAIITFMRNHRNHYAGDLVPANGALVGRHKGRESVEPPLFA